MTTKYTNQTLNIPADVCEIIESDNVFRVAEDFSLSIGIENGKVVIIDFMEYIAEGSPSLEPEEAWGLVRKWWSKVKEANKYHIAISEKVDEISKLQQELNALRKAEKKTSWRLW